MKGSIIMNKELNNAINNNEKVYEDNKEATVNSIKTLEDVIVAMNEINTKLDAPISDIKTLDDVISAMDKYQH
jgi:hypothetical protein